ncbi:TonB-dependent receptor [Pseudoalteromonas denitrificans]|uniref:TonB-dependent Receptor Plug Domain n=1 Tax=Pseudoalteromonas denitrificans DSM 6059 TaxID=1123010 RepID=A0A1I1U6N1_9GAMM|nr:TonB-dependent receptor [Pseudoalteromonas denitrificans]SFD66354.1 TonB-dependent Receptor Plug Domain [Pseudoalteromonas denitrificans DSM 6059]
MLSNKTLIALACSTALSPFLATQAQITKNIEHIEVTGSHIKRVDLESASPVTIINAADIALSGISSVEELLQEMTASAGPAGNATNAYWTSNGYATAQINLRGMGIKRTLVLLNGRRLVAGGTGANDSPDLNMIPVALIKQVEVLKDGASAIYGADAVAGVVNIITKQDFSGAELTAKAGSTDQGDGKNQEFNLILGGDFDRGNAVINFNYVKTGSVLQSARNPCPLTENNGKLECFYSGRTAGGRALLADGSEVQFNQDFNGDGNAYETYNNSKHGYNWFESLNSYSPMQRFNFASLVNFNINDNLQLSSELIYAKRKSEQIVTPRSFKNFEVAKDFIYNPTDQDLTLKSRRNTEVADPEFYQETDTIQANFALNGSLTNDWQWQLSYNFGRNTGVDGWSYDMNDEKVAHTLDASICSVDINAAIPCGDYFGINELSPEVIDYITYQREGSGGNEMRAWSGQLTGDLIELNAGSLAFAFGLESRSEKGWRNPDSIAQLNGEEDAIAGKFNVKEAYLELSVPLLADVDYAKSLSTDIAIRYSDYSTFGSNNTYKLGLTWRINDAVMLRGVKSTAFRTPTISELFGGTNSENLITIDPCENATGTILTNCTNAGVPISFEQDGSTIKTGVGGNPEVGPETANTFTLGAVIQLPIADDLSLTVDYFDIKIDDAINSVAGSNMLRLCYSDPIAYAGYCQSFSRDTITHQVTALEKRPMNAANEHVNGIDFNIAYKSEINNYQLNINWDTTHLLKHENTAFAGAETEVLLGKITADRGSFTKWKSNLNAKIHINALQLGYSLRFIGKADDENGGGPIGQTVPSISYHDIQANYHATETLNLSMGIDNLFNKQAPYLTSWNDANTDVFTYDTVGRRGYIKMNYRF